MLNDPLSVTYDGNAKSLPRVSVMNNGSIYRTADGEFRVEIRKTPRSRDGKISTSVMLVRRLPDPTPSNVFDDFRVIENSFGISLGFDLTRSESSVDIPKLRTALLAFADSTLQSRLIGGEL